MIIQKGNISAITNEETVGFELNNDEGHLYSVLSELYSKPVESTIREISTNCTDAHILNRNEERPFIIKLPNYEKNILNLCFRDFGPGLTHEEVQKIYRIYGVSTKTNSNNVTGCLGLGSKSPFSITSTFFVKSYYNGVCSQYTCAMDNFGKPSISKEPQTFKTEEENGLEVIIPFYKEVNFQDILPNILKYFKVKPTVIRQEGLIDEDTIININWKMDNYIQVTKLTDTIEIATEFINPSYTVEFLTNSYKRSNNIENEVIQLQIYYPLDTKLILDTIDRYNKMFTDENNRIVKNFKISNEVIDYIKILLKIGIRFRSLPGRIAFSPSRENIKYTDLTLYYIIKELVKAAKNYTKIIYSKFDNINTYDKIFDMYILNYSKFTKVIDYFKLSGAKNIKPLLEELKSKKFGSKNFLGFKNVYSSMHFMENDSHIYPNENSIKELESVRNYLSSKMSYVNIFNGVDGKTVVQKENVLFYTLIDPFFESVIEASIRKIYSIYISKLIEVGNSTIQKLKNLTVSEKTKLVSGNEIELIIKFFCKNDYDSYTTLNDTNIIDDFGLKTFGPILNTRHSFDMEFNSIYLKPEEKKYFDTVNEINPIREFLQVLHIFIEFKKNINYQNNLYSLNLYEAVEYLKTNILENLEYDNMIPSLSATFNKLVIIEEKNPKNFIKKINESDFVFEDLYERFSLYKHMAKINKYYPLNNFKIIASKWNTNNNSYYAQVILHTYIKFFYEDFKRSILFIKDSDARKKDIVNELISFGIPTKYAVEIQNIDLIKSDVKYTRSKTSNQSSSSSHVYYYNFSLTKNLIDEFKYILFKYIKLSIMCCDNYINKLILNSDNALNYTFIFNTPIRNAQQNWNSDNLFLNNIPKEILDLYIVVKNLKVDFNIDYNNNEAITNLYNIIIKKIVYLDSKIENLLGHIPYNMLQIIKENRSPIFKYDDNIGVVLDEELFLNLDAKNLQTDINGDKFIWFNRKTQQIPIKNMDGSYEKLFKNKIVFIDDNIKLKDFSNPFPETINLDLLRETGSDSLLRTTKKIFKELNTSTKTDLIQLLKKYFPDYIFLEVSDLSLISKKYKDSCYNFYPFLLKFWYDSGISEVYENCIMYNGGRLDNFRQDFHILPNLWSQTYYKVLKTYISKYEFIKGCKFSKNSKIGKEITFLKNILHTNTNAIWVFSSPELKLEASKIVGKFIHSFGSKSLEKQYLKVCRDIIEDERKISENLLKILLLTFNKISDPKPSLDNLSVSDINNTQFKLLEWFYINFRGGKYSSSTVGNIRADSLDYFKNFHRIKEMVSQIENILPKKKLYIGNIISNNGERTILSINTKPKFMNLVSEINSVFKDIYGSYDIYIDKIEDIFATYFKTKTIRKVIKHIDQNPLKLLEKLSKIEEPDNIHEKINLRTKGLLRGYKSIIKNKDK